MFENKILLITGGTGSFGNAVLRRFLDSDIAEIRIFSRDEKKQDDMRKKYNNPKLKFYIGDVRDVGSVRTAVRGADYVFHAAALKQVPSCEFYPLQAVNTNVLGTENVLEEAIALGVERVICLSTDKAVYPINAMGISKAMMEKVVVAKSRQSSETTICVTRYGNVMASRGSVIPLFVDQIRAGKTLTVTDPAMTRFMMTLDVSSICVFCGSKFGKNPAYRKAARDFGRLLATRSVRLVYGGGRIGLMGDVAEAVLDGGGEITGVVPEFLMEYEIGDPGGGELIIVDSMHQRKREMFERSDAFVVLPGGLGTIDEAIEMLRSAPIGQNCNA